jgi:nucleotide-binding universal stress UspA family protein
MLMSDVRDEATEPTRRILHTTDFSPASETAFVHALKLAVAARAEIDVLHAAPERTVETWTEFPGIRDTLRRWDGDGPPAGTGVAPRSHGIRVGKIMAIDGDPVHAAVGFVQEHPTELVVLATEQRRGLARWTQRSTAEPIARESGAMTLFIPGPATGFVSWETGEVGLERILVPVDHAPSPRAAVDAVEALVRGLGASRVTARLLHVGEASMPDAPVPRNPACGWDVTTRSGSAVDEIVGAAEAWSADLIVMATAGHADVLDALRGSTTERVLRLARCPVLAVPAGSRAMRRLFSAVS